MTHGVYFGHPISALTTVLEKLYIHFICIYISIHQRHPKARIKTYVLGA